MTPDDSYAGGWFGQDWGAPVCDPARRLATPEGDLCIDCLGLIGDGDRGLAVPFVYEAGSMTLTYHHHACWMRGLQPLLDKLAG
jgi:hypothetical protein